MKNLKKFGALLVLILLTAKGFTQEIRSEILSEIEAQIALLRTAHLKSDVTLVDKIYHPNLILTSQSGKKYKKDIALKNIENTFESYEYSDIEFLRVSDDALITNYINERKYKDFPKGKFRLTVVWTRHEDKWKIISMQSSKIKESK